MTNQKKWILDIEYWIFLIPNSHIIKKLLSLTRVGKQQENCLNQSYDIIWKGITSVKFVLRTINFGG